MFADEGEFGNSQSMGWILPLVIFGGIALMVFIGAMAGACVV